MKFFKFISLAFISSAVVYAQNPHKAVQAVTFAVNSSHHSSFVGAKSLTIPLSNETSTSANASSLIVSNDVSAAKKITVALNSSLPKGIALRLTARQQHDAAPVQKIISTTPSEIVAGYIYSTAESFRKIQLRYNVMSVGSVLSSSDQTVIYTITD
ncbi:MAG: hypothetical protein HY089_08730 [Ignavibacteriales bacterium]|nr:hypothetical protein [Ignavibacteriales bacterium]